MWADWEYIEDENDDGSKTCVSCEHYSVDMDNDRSPNYCDVDGHYVGYVDCWTRTCKHHRLRKES